MQQNQIETLSQQLEESRKVAFQAMSYSSDLGDILLFIEGSFSIDSEPELVDRLLTVLGGLGVEAAACCYTDAGTNRYGLQSEPTDQEMEYIQSTRWEHRIASKGEQTAFNYDHISCLVRDMPIDNDERYGILKDVVATLLNSAEERLKSIEKDQRILKAQNELLEMTDKTTADISKYFTEINSDATRVLGELMDDMKGVVMEIDVDDEHEEQILQLIDSHVSLIVQISERCQQVDQSFDELKNCIANISRECEVSEPWPHKTIKWDNDAGAVDLF